MTAKLTININQELRQLIDDVATERGQTLNELLVPIVAKELNRPDLAYIPRKKMGRPRRTQSA